MLLLNNIIKYFTIPPEEGIRLLCLRALSQRGFSHSSLTPCSLKGLLYSPETVKLLPRGQTKQVWQKSENSELSSGSGTLLLVRVRTQRG